MKKIYCDYCKEEIEKNSSYALVLSKKFHNCCKDASWMVIKYPEIAIGLLKTYKSWALTQEFIEKTPKL